MADNYQPFAEQMKIREAVEASNGTAQEMLRLSKRVERLTWAMMALAAGQIALVLYEIFWHPSGR